jgi:hypothetical protein
MSSAPGDQARDLPAEIEPSGSVRLAVQDRRPRAHLREQGANVGLVILVQQRARGIARRARPLERHQRVDVRAARILDEDANHHLRAEASPVGPDEGHDGRPEVRRGQVRAVGAHAVHHQLAYSVGVTGCDRADKLAALRGTKQVELAGARACRIGDREAGGHLTLEGEVRRVLVRQPAAGLVPPDHGEALSEPLNEGAEGEQVKLRAQVRHPA